MLFKKGGLFTNLAHLYIWLFVYLFRDYCTSSCHRLNRLTPELFQVEPDQPKKPIDRLLVSKMIY